MKISKKIREEAILVLDIAACEETPSDVSFEDITENVEVGNLAFAAFYKVPDTTKTLDEVGPKYQQATRFDFASAAGILRDGWSPGEDISYLETKEIL